MLLASVYREILSSKLYFLRLDGLEIGVKS